MSYRLAKISSVLLATVFIFVGFFASAQEAGHMEAVSKEEQSLNIRDVILHHVMDDHVWHFFDGHYGTLYPPVILYSSEKGLDVFSSSNFFDEHHNRVPYDGYILDEHNHISIQGSETPVWDFSITKNVVMLLFTGVVLIVLLRSAAKGYERNRGKAPKGVQSLLEPVIVFVRDEIVKPNIGHRYEKYLPYMLTLFFFVFVGNLLGLLPGAANLTGNIAITLTLAVLTFIITNVKGNKAYWSQIFWTPGVPLPLRLVILPVEIIGLFTKPFSLTVRLFVAITAGHIVLLSLICLAFIFHSYVVGFVSSLIVLFINLIELLVAGIQAYVFTLFSSLYIGMAITEDEHH